MYLATRKNGNNEIYIFFNKPFYSVQCKQYQITLSIVLMGFFFHTLNNLIFVFINEGIFSLNAQ